MNNAPIGVFDSGQGGLSVWSELYRRLPHESLLYYGDGKNCPYGNQPRERIVEYSDYAVRRMLSAGVKMVVIACNTATAAAIDHLRITYDVPFVGLEPAVKPCSLLVAVWSGFWPRPLRSKAGFSARLPANMRTGRG